MDCGEIWQFRHLQVENKVNYLTIWPQLLGHSHQFLSLDEQFIQACTNSNHWMTDHIFLKLEIHAYSSPQSFQILLYDSNCCYTWATVYDKVTHYGTGTLGCLFVRVFALMWHK